MNAAEARKRRGGSTLLERTKADPARAARIERLVASASIEQIVQAIMDNQRVSAAELARRIKVEAPQISRDLHGGLSRATVSRLSTIAEALGYEFVPAFVPRTDDAKRKRFLKLYRELVPEVSPQRVPLPQTPTEAKRKAKAKKTTTAGAKRRVA